MPGKKIIVEGVDGAGKTTMIREKFSKMFNGEDYDIIHCTRSTPNTKEWFINQFISDRNIIFDRGPYGQFVYQTKADRLSRGQMKDISELYQLENLMKVFKVEVYYVYTDIDICYENCLNDADGKDKYYTRDYILGIDAKFRAILGCSTLNINYFYNKFDKGSVPFVDEVKKEEYTVSEKDVDYSKIPTIYAVDFDGVLATNSFPYIENAKPNMKLISMLKNYQANGDRVVLYTCRTGDSLIEACNFLADQEFYPDAINDNVKEVKDQGLNPRKIYASQYIDDKALKIVFEE